MVAARTNTASFSLRLFTLLCVLLVACRDCDSCEKKKDAPRELPPAEGQANSKQVNTMVGQGRAIPFDVASTNARFGRIFQLPPNIAILGGDSPGEAAVMRTENAGKDWVGFKTLADTATLIGYSVSLDGSLVISLAKRQVPKKGLPKGQLPPVDTLSYLFAPKGEGLSAPSPILAPDEKGKGPLIPKGRGMPALVAKNVGSFAIEYAPKRFAIAYGVPSTDALPPALPLPANETPIFAPYARPPVLLTSNGKTLLARKWPAPGEALGTPTPIDRVKLTKTIVDELSEGAECEHAGWSFRRVLQGKDVPHLFGVTTDRVVFFELPRGLSPDVLMGCGDGRVVFQAANPTNQEYAMVTCSLEGVCVPSEAPPFRLWQQEHERRIGIATWHAGVIAAMGIHTPQAWGFYMTRSDNAGKNYDRQRAIGEGKGDRGRYTFGALIGLEKRTLLIFASDLTGSSRRSWFALASDDAGQNWGPP